MFRAAGSGSPERGRRRIRAHHGTRHGLRHTSRHGATQVPAAGHLRENGTVSSQASATAGISAREAEVLTLVAQHLSNAEIGARLFISVRTVETHVSSLLRKLGVPDRRGLAQLAAELAEAERSGAAVARLPSPLTPFIGRIRECAALGEAIKLHRQVTAVGPGGVGKTRLALAIAAEAAGDFGDGAWFIDLVPITDPAMVGAAVAAALGIGEQQGRGVDESVLAALADRHALLVLDNCEHLREGVTPFVERLLAGCPRLTVLATSRARLMVPFERVYEVPPLSLAGGGGSDAVALFVDRAAAMGWPLEPQGHDQVAELCRELDGIALAIELAAARLPALGLDGLAAGLADHLRLLVGGSRADDRHRSVRTMLDWSYALLETADLTLLRRISVFMAPFTAGAAAEVAGFAPLEPGAVADGLARLAERSLLAVAPSAKGTRYRALETIRQYGMERLGEAGDLAAARGRAADDIRAALGWAAGQPDHRADAHGLARSLAELAFTRNLAGESQRRYEQAATLTGDPNAAASALRLAAAVAGCRMLGDDMYRLLKAAAGAARRSGDGAGAARDLAAAATTVYRFAGVFARRPPADEARALRAAARELAGDDPAAQAAVALADCGVHADAFIAELTEPETTVAETAALAERAVELARRTGDRLAESAALDALTGAHCWAGAAFDAAVTARGRTDLLSSVQVSPASACELVDALIMAADTSVAVGDLRGAERWGRQLRDLPLLAETGQIATSRLLVRTRWPATPARSWPAASGSSTRGRAPAAGGRPASAPPRRRWRWSTACAATAAPGPGGWPSPPSSAPHPSAAPASARPSTPSSCSITARRCRPWSGSQPSRTSWGSGPAGCGGAGTRRCARRPPCSPGIPTRPAASPPPGPSSPATRSPARSSIGPRRSSATTGGGWSPPRRRSTPPAAATSGREP